MKYQETIVTPQLAKRMLEHNFANNRNINDRRVETYANDMKKGEWKFNGEAIKFNKQGELMDGQHRLHAVIRANVPVKMAVIRDIDNDVYLFDKMTPRSTAQSAKMAGIDGSLANTSVCAMINLYFNLTQGKIYSSDVKIMEYMEENAENLAEAYHICMRQNKTGVSITSAPFMVAIYNAIEAGENICDLNEFAKIVGSGFYEHKNQTAAIVLRNDLIQKKILIAGEINRKNAVKKIEKAIYDFCRHNARQKSYASHDEFVYLKEVR